jgi:hypothetical protein
MPKGRLDVYGEIAERMSFLLDLFTTYTRHAEEHSFESSLNPAASRVPSSYLTLEAVGRWLSRCSLLDASLIFDFLTAPWESLDKHFKKSLAIADFSILHPVKG